VEVDVQRLRGGGVVVPARADLLCASNGLIHLDRVAITCISIL
jgi:hypothetical protein